MEDVAGPQHNARLLGLDGAVGSTSGLQPVPMRPAILATGEAARAILDAIACGVAQSRAFRFDDKLEFSARTSAMATVTPAVGTELVAAKVQGKAHLLHLEAAKLDAASGLPFASPRPTISRRRSAAARSSLKQMPEERPAVAWIHALYRHAKAPAPAGHRPLGAGRRQGADDRLDNLLPTMVGA